MTGDAGELTRMPAWYGSWDDSGWQWQAAKWPEPFSQHALVPDELLESRRAWAERMERAAAIIRGNMEISQVDT